MDAYTELGKVHDGIHQELRDRGIQADWPSVEIYGHWAEDETELETEVLVNIRVIGAKD